MLASVLLAMFYAVDSYLWRGETHAAPTVYEPLAIEGSFNFTLIAAWSGSVLLSGTWKPGIAFDIAGTPLDLQNAVRDVALLALALASLALTPRAVRERNAFYLGADRGGCEAVRGDLHHDHSRDHDPAGRARRRARRRLSTW